LRFLTLSAALLAGLLPVAAANAQSTADTTQFTAACLGGDVFLLGQLPDGVDTAPIMTPLCACLTTQFSDMPQADVDMLAADLRGEGTEEVRAAYGDYAALSASASQDVATCFADPAVAAAVEAATPPPATEAPAETTPQ